MFGFVVGSGRKGDGEGVDGTAVQFGQQQGQGAGIDAAAQQGTNRDVAHSPGVNGFFEAVVELFGGFFGRNGEIAAVFREG